ncbi:uncharacterized protein GIQ15_04000 [Arthroderma uncinatum]|uniref:uncharacterized protein n=1 Tax=Arthroderma uncinatum TaxID=74035 RepID=UPI00144A71F3|nr:uncharacterized protein GIQ15_04000 [Arthroderma uncinatum]KAF3481241.1 hypothetical protein GIQ15_04000 [Arthroderma uncinatum]
MNFWNPQGTGFKSHLLRLYTDTYIDDDTGSTAGACAAALNANAVSASFSSSSLLDDPSCMALTADDLNTLHQPGNLLRDARRSQYSVYIQNSWAHHQRFHVVSLPQMTVATSVETEPLCNWPIPPAPLWMSPYLAGALISAQPGLGTLGPLGNQVFRDKMGPERARWPWNLGPKRKIYPARTYTLTYMLAAVAASGLLGVRPFTLIVRWGPGANQARWSP